MSLFPAGVSCTIEPFLKYAAPPAAKSTASGSAQNGSAKHNKVRFSGASLHGLKNTRTVMFYISVNHRHASQRNFHYQISFLIMSANAEYCRT